MKKFNSVLIAMAALTASVFPFTASAADKDCDRASSLHVSPLSGDSGQHVTVTQRDGCHYGEVETGTFRTVVDDGVIVLVPVPDVEEDTTDTQAAGVSDAPAPVVTPVAPSSTDAVERTDPVASVSTDVPGDTVEAVEEAGLEQGSAESEGQGEADQAVAEQPAAEDTTGAPEVQVAEVILTEDGKVTDAAVAAQAHKEIQERKDGEQVNGNASDETGFFKRQLEKAQGVLEGLLDSFGDEPEVNPVHKPAAEQSSATVEPADAVNEDAPVITEQQPNDLDQASQPLAVASVKS